MFLRVIFISIMSLGFFSGCTQSEKKSISEAGSSLTSSTTNMSDGAHSIDSKQSIINQIMSESGLDEMLAALPESVAMGFDQQPKPPMSSKNSNQFRQNLIDAFDADDMRKTIVLYLDSHYEPENFSAFLAMLKKPSIQKMTRLELDSQKPQAFQEMMQSGNVIMGQTSQKRMELVRTLDRVTSSSETAVDMQMMMSSAMVVNMNKIVPSNQRMTKNQLQEMLAQMRTQSLFPTQQLLHLNMVFAYRTISDVELEAYIEEHDSALGRWATELFLAAWLKASEDVAFRLSDLMEKTFVKENAL